MLLLLSLLLTPLLPLQLLMIKIVEKSLYLQLHGLGSDTVSSHFHCECSWFLKECGDKTVSSNRQSSFSKMLSCLKFLEETELVSHPVYFQSLLKTWLTNIMDSIVWPPVFLVQLGNLCFHVLAYSYFWVCASAIFLAGKEIFYDLMQLQIGMTVMVVLMIWWMLSPSNCAQ